MNVKELIKEAHGNAVERGFYNCPSCGGEADQGFPNAYMQCSNCNGSGIDPNKNIGELLMLIVSELGEALEAHRCGRFAVLQTLDHFIKNHNQMIKEDRDQWYYSTHIKDTFEDEIADVFIRLFDLCGYLKIDTDFLYIETKLNQVSIPDNIGEFLLHLTGGICSLSNNRHIDSSRFLLSIGFTFARLIKFCNFHNIPIEKHIKAKQAYNRTRKHKHGKEY